MTIAFSAANRNITLTDRNQPALGAQIMTDNVVTGLRFVYRDRNHVLTTDMARVAWVQVLLDDGGQAPQPEYGTVPHIQRQRGRARETPMVEPRRTPARSRWQVGRRRTLFIVMILLLLVAGTGWRDDHERNAPTR